MFKRRFRGNGMKKIFIFNARFNIFSVLSPRSALIRSQMEGQLCVDIVDRKTKNEN